MERREAQAGFTLIELLVVILIVSVLSYMGLSAFYVYRADAAYSIVEQTMRNSRVSVEASVNDIDHPPVAANIVQSTQGPISDVAGRSYLPQFQVPRNVKFTAQYDPSCAVAGCQSDFLEVKHCLANEHSQWVRFGDGAEASLTHVAGGGCS